MLLDGSVHSSAAIFMAKALRVYKKHQKRRHCYLSLILTILHGTDSKKLPERMNKITKTRFCVYGRPFQSWYGGLSMQRQPKKTMKNAPKKTNEIVHNL